MNVYTAALLRPGKKNLIVLPVAELVSTEKSIGRQHILFAFYFGFLLRSTKQEVHTNICI